MSDWDPKKVPGEYRPHIGANTPLSANDPGGGPNATYADLDYLRNQLNTLLAQVRELENRLEEEMTGFALQVGDYDPRLVESHRKEWPNDLEVRDQVSYRYYKALRFRNTTSASYIRKRYKEAARGVTGTNAIDVLEVAAIIRDEALLVQEFLNAYVGNVDDSSEFRLLELFQDWVRSARANVQEFWTFFETGRQVEEGFSQEELRRTSTEEAKRGQAVFKVKLNSYNSAIHKDLEFLKKNFSEFAPDFYTRFLGPALKYRLDVGRNILPTGGRLAQEMEEASMALDGNLRTAFADQLRRSKLFSSKMKKVRDDMKERDKYRAYIFQLSVIGNAVPNTGPHTMEQTHESDSEVHYWYEVEREEEKKQEEQRESETPVVDGTFVASHADLEDLDGNDHPQYLLRSGGVITGNISMDPGATVDGMRPSTHRHTGADGSPQIDGRDIINHTLSEDVVNTAEKPVPPTSLKMLSHRLNTRPPGVTVVDTTIEWIGNPDHNYEVQVVQVRRD